MLKIRRTIRNTLLDFGGGKVVRIPGNLHNDGELHSLYNPYATEIPVLSEILQIGNYAVVPKFEWVVIEGVTGYGGRPETRITHFGDTVTIERISGDTLTVSYRSSGGNSYGTSCKYGDRFSLSEYEFRNMNAEYRAIRDAHLQEMGIVERILGRRIYGKSINAGEWNWARSVNIVPHRIPGTRDRLKYGDNRGIGSSNYGTRIAGGTMSMRGRWGGNLHFALWEYTAYDSPRGATVAPSGMLYFGNLKGEPISGCVVWAKELPDTIEKADTIEKVGTIDK